MGIENIVKDIQNKIGSLSEHNVRFEHKNLMIVLLDNEYYGTYDMNRKVFLDDVESIVTC